MLSLAQSLELQDVENFDIVSPNIEMKDYFLQTSQNIYNQAVSNKPEIKSQEFSVKSAEKSLKIAKSAYFPTINLNAGVSTNYFFLYNNLQNKAFNRQFNENLSENVSLSLSIPIFNRLSVINQEKQAKFNIENQRLVLENAKKQLFKEIQTAYLNAVTANEKQNTATQAVTAAQEAFRYAQERYNNGKSSVFELTQSQNRLSQAKAEEAQAKYDYIFKIKVLEFYTKK